jgi:transcriptional regulator with XRE-family HTH domain
MRGTGQPAAKGRTKRSLTGADGMVTKRATSGFGGRLRKARDAAKLSQTGLAELCGRSRSWIAEIELGAEPRLQDAITLAQVLSRYGIDPVELLFGADGAGTVGEGGSHSVNRGDHVRRALSLPEGAAVSLPDVDVERLSTAALDDRLLDGFETLAHAHARVRPVLAPADFMPMIQSHLAALQSLINERSAHDSDYRRLMSIASGVAAVAAWTAMTMEHRRDARAYLVWAESAAREVHDTEALMLILLLQADMASPIPSAGLEGYSSAALGKLTEARSLAGPSTPAALQVPVAARTAEEHAFMGDGPLSMASMDEADRLYASLPNRDYFLRDAWQPTSGMLPAMRGHCLSLLGESNEAVRVITPTVATTRFAGTRAARIADLAAAHAQLGEVDRACELLEQSLDVTAGSGEVEKARRVAGIRRRYLSSADNDPAVRRLDERLAAIL